MFGHAAPASAGGSDRPSNPSDLSATLFLSAPDSYDGGELVVRNTFGERGVKLAAGAMVLYLGTTRGARLAAFFWVQSMVRDVTQRTVLFELDQAIQQLATDVHGHGALIELAGVNHNLLRVWADP